MTLIERMQRVINSDPNFDFNGANIVFKSFHAPRGGAHKKILDFDRDSCKKGSIIKIKNDDNLCLARCVVVALAKDKDHEWNRSYKTIADSRKKMQETLARQLHEEAKVSEIQCGIEEAKAFEDTVKRNIVIFQTNKPCIYQGRKYENSICVVLHKGHYDLITSIAGFMNKSYFCFECMISYKDKISIHANQHVTYANQRIVTRIQLSING